MRISKMSGCERKAGNREMDTSMQGEMDLKRRVLDLGRSLAMADTRSSRSIRACLILGLAGKERVFLIGN